jgi:hypothetical protein
MESFREPKVQGVLRSCRTVLGFVQNPAMHPVQVGFAHVRMCTYVCRMCQLLCAASPTRPCAGEFGRGGPCYLWVFLNAIAAAEQAVVMVLMLGGQRRIENTMSP